jgi:hypothetical protein
MADLTKSAKSCVLTVDDDIYPVTITIKAGFVGLTDTPVDDIRLDCRISKAATRNARSQE